MYVEIRNDFHNTVTAINPRHVGDYTYRVSPAVVKRVRHELCRNPACACGGFLAERGPQGWSGVVIPLNNGGVDIEFTRPPERARPL